MKILVLNSGSSSQKSCLYDFPNHSLPSTPPKPVWAAQVDWTDQDSCAELKVKTASGVVFEETYSSESKLADTVKALGTLWSGTTQVIESPQDIDIVGHRSRHSADISRPHARCDAPRCRCLEGFRLLEWYHSTRFAVLCWCRLILTLRGKFPERLHHWQF